MRTVRIAVLGVALCIAALYGAYLLSNARTFQLFGDLTARVGTTQPLVALTFDDGPTAGFTQPVLDILAAKNVRATFFLTGKEIGQNPDQAKAIVAAGHEIGNHSFSHPRMVFVGPEFVRRQIEDTDAAIRAAGFEGTIHFRPPYAKKLVTLPWYLAKNKRHTIMWDVEPESFADIDGDAAAIAEHVAERAGKGSIVLLHVMYEGRAASRQALPDIIDRLRLKGFRLVTVSELMAAADQAP